MDCSLPRLLCPWDSPGKNTGVGCHFLLQKIFSTQESNPGLLHCRQILYQLSYEGSPYYVPSNNGEIKIKVILVILSLVKSCISYIVIPTRFFLNACNVLIIKSRILQGFDIRLIGLQFPEIYPFLIFVFDVSCPFFFESVTHWCPTLWDPMDYVAHQAPTSMKFSRQEYWNGLPFPSPGDLPNPGIEPSGLLHYR